MRKDNIMVEMVERNTCKVTGIIDWEDAGYYPDYFGSTTLTRTMLSRVDDDWYKYLPLCIDPARFPIVGFSIEYGEFTILVSDRDIARIVY